MARLVYGMVTSLDGYAVPADGDLGAGAEDEEVHTYIGDLFRDLGTYLYGRRMYETMAVWETEPALAAHSDVTRDFAEIWQATEKIVYSRTLETASTTRTHGLL